MSERDKVINDFEAFREEPDGLIVVGAGVMDKLSTWKARAESETRRADESEAFGELARQKFVESTREIGKLSAERDTLKARCEKLEEVAKAIKECSNCNWRSNHFCGWHGVSVRKLLFPES